MAAQNFGCYYFSAFTLEGWRLMSKNVYMPIIVYTWVSRKLETINLQLPPNHVGTL